MKKKLKQTIQEDNSPRRVKILNKGAKLTTGDRNKIYGEAYDNMKHFSGLLSAYFLCKFTPEDAAMIMVLAKNSRVAVGKSFHEDNYVDGATYMAIAGEARARDEAV